MPRPLTTLLLTSLLATLGLGLSAPAFAQAQPRLPVHGWVRADLDSTLAASRGQIGVTLPISRVTALAIEVQGDGIAAGADIGPTFEAGALYLAPMVGAEYAYATGDIGIAQQLLIGFEAPPLPLYVESTVRNVYRLDGTDVLSDRTLILITLRKWLALGPEHDGAVDFAGTAGDTNQWGLRANFGLGKHAVLGAFAGYELNADARAASSLGGFAARGTVFFTF